MEPAPMTSNPEGNRPLRIGLVGTGIGRLHAAGIARMPDLAQLAAVCSLAENAQSVGQQYGAGYVTSRYADLLEDRGIDVIDLCVPHIQHLPMALAAARAGKHLLVEKPLARTLAEADQIIAAARAAGVRLMTGHNQRYYGHHAKAKELLDAGTIGKPYMIVASVHVHGHIEGFRRRQRHRQVVDVRHAQVDHVDVGVLEQIFVMGCRVLCAEQRGHNLRFVVQPADGRQLSAFGHFSDTLGVQPADARSDHGDAHRAVADWVTGHTHRSR